MEASENLKYEFERREVIQKILNSYLNKHSKNRDLLQERLNLAIPYHRFEKFKKLEKIARLDSRLRGDRLMARIEKLVPEADLDDQKCFDEFSYYVFLFCSSKSRRIKWSTRWWIKKMVNAPVYYPRGRLTNQLLNSYKDHHTKPPSVFGFWNGVVFGRELLADIDECI